MPELPEVETIKQGIIPLIKNKVIKNVIVRNTKLRYPVTRNLAKILISQTVNNITRRGKYLIFYCNSGSLIIHLGMSGTLTIVPYNAPVKKHDHIDICFSNEMCLRFNDVRRFGCVIWTQDDPLQHRLLSDLGVEPLTKNFSANYLFSKSRNKKIAIKKFIMNNKIVVGIGNIYVCEVLFLAKIAPTISVGNISKEQYIIIVRLIKRILKKAIAAGGTSVKDYCKADGKLGYFQQQLLVYGRQNQPCKICGTIIKTIRLGQRNTFFCPKCQI